ncbi:MAG: phosphodiesterase [Hyphomicrobium sp.]|jgi:diguanylate cyclase (GGDEF)-like protein
MLTGIEETTYTWDVATDQLDWQANAVTLLGVRSLGEISTGAHLQAHIVPEHTTRWHDAILGSKSRPAGSEGVPYRVQYRFVPDVVSGSSVVWLEDTGRWWPGPSGRPMRARGIVRIITERYLEEQRLLQRDDDESSSGQVNRVRLTEALTSAISRSEHARQSSALFIVAVNNLAVLNSTFGFDIGDEIIDAVERVLKSKLRSGDVLGRYSSNKFGIIVNDCDPGAMRIIAERFIDAVRNAKLETSSCQVTATIAIGAAAIPEHATTVPQAMSNALQALDRAKQTHMGTVAVYQPDLAYQNKRQRNITIADSVVKALNEGRMRFLLQPIVNSQTGETELYECLLRMVRTDGTLVSAGEFIEVAEQLGLARLIDRHTLELATRLLEQNPGLRLSLNVSSLTANDNDWIVALHRLTAGDRTLTQRLTIEITETAMIRDIGQIAAFVDVLHKFGCGVAIDDFGAGYTSFRHLKQLDVDTLKIDGTFVKDLPDDPQGRVFIKTMVEVAKSFGMKTVAEWVRTEAAAQFLREAGIDYLQGFLYGEPISPDKLPKAK